ncbi:MAG: rod-binding protein [Hyphomicrobiales bacterium]|nr:rod-binding protein [Hyphomicrobiales bacterium]
MAFNPPTDVVLEVLNAADPARASLAAERLAALASASAAPGDFAADLNRAAAAGPAGPRLAGVADGRTRRASPAETPGGAERVKLDFEATMLNPLIGELLPKEASVFGEGYAGEMWRSMLSEQIARQVAKSGALGLSRKLFATHDIVPREAARRSEAAGAQTAAMSSNLLSAPSAALIENGAVLFSGKRS